MSGHQTTLFFDLLLSCFLVMSVDTLGQKLSEARALEDLNKDFVRLFDHAQTEAGHTDLCNGSVVEDLVVNVLH